MPSSPSAAPGTARPRSATAEAGEPRQVEDFLFRFLTNDRKATFGRVAGLAVANDGSLLVSDDMNGVIYRVSYRADRKAETTD